MIYSYYGEVIRQKTVVKAITTPSSSREFSFYMKWFHILDEIVSYLSILFYFRVFGIYKIVFCNLWLKKKLPANAGDARDVGLIPGLGNSPKKGDSNPFQYPCLEESH